MEPTVEYTSPPSPHVSAWQSLEKAQSESELSDRQRAKLATLRAEIATGIEQAGRGDFVEFNADEIIAGGRERPPALTAAAHLTNT